MRSVRVASSSLPLLACVLLILLLHASSNAPVGAVTRKSSNNLIRVWAVGSPYRDALPPAVVPAELRQRAESLGYTIEIEAFPIRGFVGKFRQALQDHTEPEILTFDNYSVISGMTTPTVSIEGIDSNRLVASSFALVHETLTSLQQRGWIMLIRSAANYEAARALSMRAPECEPPSGRVADLPTIDPALRQAEEKAVFATRAYLDCDRSTLSAISDPSRLVQQCFLPQSDTKVESVKACRVTGNQNLAFVTLVSGFSAEAREPHTLVALKPGMDLGQKSILAVLRNQGGTWRLLAITHDPLNTVARIPLSTNTLANSLDDGRSTGITPDPARLLTLDGVFPVPVRGERFGDFTWQPSQSNDVIGQVVEFMWGKNTNSGLTRLLFLPATENKLSSGYLMNGGTMVWRVWSINKSGDVAFSEQRSFRN